MAIGQVNIVNLISIYSSLLGFDADIALAVAKVESNYNPNAIGKLGEIGVFQIRPEFYPSYTIENLKDESSNIVLGIKKLKEERRLCPLKTSDLDFLICYNRGRSGALKVSDPSQDRYLNKVKREIEKNGAR